MWKYFTARNTFCYFDVLPEFIKSYNHSFHRTIHTRPVVNFSNSSWVWKTVYGDCFKIKPAAPVFRKGHHVRVSRTKGRFEKGYEQTFPYEIFIVDEVLRRVQTPGYRLKDYKDEPIEFFLS